MTATIEVGRDRLLKFCTNRCESLGKFWRGEAIARQALLIQPAELLQLAGLEALEISVNGLDGGFNPICADLRRPDQACLYCVRPTA